MDLIEQAAKRLQELRRAGVEMPESPAISVVPQAVPRDPGLEVVSREVAAKPQVSSRKIELDLSAMAAEGVVTPGAERSQLADELRVIKRPLLSNATRKGPSAVRDGNLIMITSAVPGEGKSFSAVNLAMSIAMELDHTVLLVDADVARPRLPEILGIEPEKGLMDVLLDSNLDLNQVLLRSNIEKLTILLSGTRHPRATELLASDAMIRLLAEMASRYSDRIIIFDSPPVLVTTEARALATHMGQVVVVVRAESTTQSDVRHALAAVDACPVRMVLLNQARGARSSHGYGFGYGYGYDHEQAGGAPEQAESRPAR